MAPDGAVSQATLCMKIISLTRIGGLILHVLACLATFICPGEKSWRKLLFLLNHHIKLRASPGSFAVVTIQIAVMCVMLGMDTADS